MRELVFEPKPAPKSRVGRKKNVHEDGGAESAYEVRKRCLHYVQHSHVEIGRVE
jgi:hypothetical protein